MGMIQSSINSMIGSASHAIMAVRGYQQLTAKKNAAAERAKAKQMENAQNSLANSTPQTSPQAMAAQQAKQSAQNAINAKKEQKRSFKDYLAKQPSSLGPIGKLPPAIQKQIESQFTPRQRQTLMNKVDKEANNGKHK